jgi:hypothetical protein
VLISYKEWAHLNAETTQVVLAPVTVGP